MTWTNHKSVHTSKATGTSGSCLSWKHLQHERLIAASRAEDVGKAAGAGEQQVGPHRLVHQLICEEAVRCPWPSLPQNGCACMCTSSLGQGRGTCVGSDQSRGPACDRLCPAGQHLCHVNRQLLQAWQSYKGGVGMGEASSLPGEPMRSCADGRRHA